MQKLTKEEERIMMIIWDKQKTFVKEIIEALPEPHPPYSTISSVVRILEKKGFVDHEAFGKTHRYFPIVSIEDYRKKETDRLVKNYFNGSVRELVSFFAKSEKTRIDELKELLDELEQKSGGSENE